MEYRWEETNPASDNTLNLLAMDGWEVIPGIVAERNKTVFVMMHRPVIPRIEDDPTAEYVGMSAPPAKFKLNFPTLAEGWEEIVDNAITAHTPPPPRPHLRVGADDPLDSTDVSR
jgi:hypothetical protein